MCIQALGAPLVNTDWGCVGVDSIHWWPADIPRWFANTLGSMLLASYGPQLDEVAVATKSDIDFKTFWEIFSVQSSVEFTSIGMVIYA